jgi:ABC-2 type transport system ATP-binding protein
MEEAEICNKVAIIDHGKIVAHDTPYNLKKKYTSTTMKLRTSKQENLIKYLSECSLKFKQDIEQVTVYATDVEKVLEIISVFRDSIGDIEINKGTLNDVFIAITGKEIRV